MMNNNDVLNDVVSCLNLFERGSIPLHQLVGELKVLQDDLEGFDDAWLAEFDRLRFALEEVNAIRLDEEYSGSDEYDSFLTETVEKLKAHVQG
ncbi:MAG: hypothetical protein KatS3mg111_0478 [Pirellulaceae bacterium]|nr:MAG: hypothetical protein KatS3mg111_0478 [Pirellulaceae bacterium]